MPIVIHASSCHRYVACMTHYVAGRNVNLFLCVCATIPQPCSSCGRHMDFFMRGKSLHFVGYLYGINFPGKHSDDLPLAVNKLIIQFYTLSVSKRMDKTANKWHILRATTDDDRRKNVASVTDKPFHSSLGSFSFNGRNQSIWIQRNERRNDDGLSCADKKRKDRVIQSGMEPEVEWRTRSCGKCIEMILCVIFMPLLRNTWL